MDQVALLNQEFGTDYKAGEKIQDHFIPAEFQDKKDSKEYKDGAKKAEEEVAIYNKVLNKLEL